MKIVHKCDVTSLCRLLGMENPTAMKSVPVGGADDDEAAAPGRTEKTRHKSLVLRDFKQLHCLVWEKSMKDDLRVNMSHLGAFRGSRVDPKDFNVLPKLSSVQTDAVQTFIQWGWHLQGLFDGMYDRMFAVAGVSGCILEVCLKTSFVLPRPAATLGKCPPVHSSAMAVRVYFLAMSR